MPDLFGFDLPLSQDPPHAFISYSSEQRGVAGRCKEIIEAIGLPTFAAHDDIEVSAEWKEAIRSELRQTDVFVALLSQQFTESKWAPQEVGIAYDRDMKILPLSLDGTVPFGFINHIQSRPVGPDADLEELIVERVVRWYPRTCIPYLIHRLKDARNYREGETLMAPLVPFFELFNPEEAQAFAAACTNNDDIWNAHGCRDEDIPTFLDICGPLVSRDVAVALQHQITRQEWYDPVAVSVLAEQFAVPVQEVLDVARDRFDLELEEDDTVERSIAIAIRGAWYQGQQA